MTALYRPEILATTFWSFYKGLFHQFPRRTLILNVDPTGVPNRYQKQKKDDILRLASASFTETLTRFPEQGDFAAAVYWLWQSATERGESFLHLEDDWALNRPVPIDRVFQALRQPGVASVRLHRQRNLSSPYSSKLSLNPIFLNSAFIREALVHFRCERDPEKQFSEDPLLTALRHWRHRVMPGENLVGGELACADSGGWVSDLGIHWRKGLGLVKTFSEGKPIWIESETRWTERARANILLGLKLYLYRMRFLFNALFSGNRS